MGEAKRRRGKLEKQLRELSRPLGADETLAPGRMTVMIFFHDDWCAHFTGGPCNCEPEMELREVSQATLDHPSTPGQG